MLVIFNMLAAYTVANCQPFDGSLFSYFAVIMTWYPVFLSAGMYGLTLYNQQLALTIYSVLHAVGVVCIMFWQWVFQISPPVVGCGGAWAMPHIYIFSAYNFMAALMGWSLAFEYNMTHKNQIMLVLTTSVSTASMVLLNYASISQLAVSAVVGILNGCMTAFISLRMRGLVSRFIMSRYNIRYFGWNDTIIRTLHEQYSGLCDFIHENQLASEDAAHAIFRYLHRQGGDYSKTSQHVAETME